MDNTGYDYVAAAKGRAFALAYLPTARQVTFNSGKLGWSGVHLSWFDPRDGMELPPVRLEGTGGHRLKPPGEGA